MRQLLKQSINYWEQNTYKENYSSYRLASHAGVQPASPYPSHYILRPSVLGRDSRSSQGRTGGTFQGRPALPSKAPREQGQNELTPERRTPADYPKLRITLLLRMTAFTVCLFNVCSYNPMSPPHSFWIVLVISKMEVMQNKTYWQSLKF